MSEIDASLNALRSARARLSQVAGKIVAIENRREALKRDLQVLNAELAKCRDEVAEARARTRTALANPSEA